MPVPFAGLAFCFDFVIARITNRGRIYEFEIVTMTNNRVYCHMENLIQIAAKELFGSAKRALKR